MEIKLTGAQVKALERAISCYLETVDNSDEQFLLREIVNKLGARSDLSDTVRQML